MRQPTTTPVGLPPTQPPHAITTRTTVTERGNDGIIRAHYNAPEETVEDARENVAAVRLLIPEGRALLLVDARTTGTMSPEIRSYYTSEEAAQVIGALAFLVESAASRLAGNILLRFQHPQIRTRLFTDEVLALRWLQSQRQGS